MAKKKVIKKKKEKIKSKRKRVPREVAKQRMSNQGGGNNWFKLPEGIETWAPDKKGRYMLDILPYEITTKNHPEEGIDEGVLWFRTQFRIHHGIGSEQQSIVCPKSIGKKCIICAEADRLRKEDKDANEEAINQLKGQLYVAMNIIHPDDSDQIAVLILSYGKFDKVLREELQEEENEEHLDFYQCDEGGRTLKVRFSEKTFAGNKYLAATDIVFKEREEMDEDEILGRTIDLDNILNVFSAEKIESIFLEADDDDDNEEEIETKKKPKKRKAKKKNEEPVDEVEEDEEEEIEDEEDEDECVACEGTGENSKGGECHPCKGTGIKQTKDEEEEEEEDEEDEVEDEEEDSDWDEDEEDEEDEVEDEEEDSDWDEDEEDEEDDWDEDWDEDEEEEEDEPEPPKKKKKKKK